MDIIELKIDDEDNKLGVSAIALTDNPAIEINWQKFSKSEDLSKHSFKLENYQFNSEQREILGVAMVPGMLIDRVKESGESYQVVFSKETVKKNAINFFRTNSSQNVNENHDENKQVKGMVLFQSFIVDANKGITYKDAVDGSWVVGYKVDNDDIWSNIKEEKFTGFSVEGMFKEELIKMESIEKKECPEIKKETYSNRMKKEIKVILSALNVIAGSEMQKFTDVTLADGTIVQADTETVEVGTILTIDNGVEVLPLPTMDYVLQDGTKISVEDGEVKAIVLPDAPASEEVSAPVAPAEMSAQSKAKFESLEQRFNELVKENESIKKLITSLADKNSKFEKLAVEAITELSNVTPEPTEVKSAFKASDISRKEDKISRLKEAFKTYNK